MCFLNEMVIVCMFAYQCLDANTHGVGEEGYYLEAEEEDQGQFANQGKPSLDHTNDPCFTMHTFFYKVHT